MDNPEKRIGYWWRHQRECPTCRTPDIPISNFWFDAEGQFRIEHLCVKCGKEFFWNLNPFHLARLAHDRDDFETFNRTPETVEQKAPKEGADWANRPNGYINVEWRRAGSPYRGTKHHVPPRNPDRNLRTIKVDERHHRAYHLLFGAAPSLAGC